MQRPISAAEHLVLVRFRTGNISVGWVLGSFDNGISCRSLLEKEVDGLRSGDFHRRFRLPDHFDELWHVGCGTLD